MVAKKVCCTCKRELPFDSFHRNKRMPDGRHKRCKDCRKIETSDYYERNAKIIIAKTGAYYRAHREQALAGHKRLRILHREAHIKRAMAWVKGNPDKRKVIANRWYHRHKNEPHQIEYRKAKEKARDKEKIRVKSQKRRASEVNASGSHSAAELRELYERQEHRCAYCGIPIFRSIRRDMHLDHIVPLVKGGSNDIRNLLFSCQECNLSKGNKTFAEWQSTRGW